MPNFFKLSEMLNPYHRMHMESRLHIDALDMSARATIVVFFFFFFFEVWFDT